MTHHKALCGTTAILLALTGTAQADVTSADVWANWKAAAESVGQTLTPGNETSGGGVISLTDVAIAMSMPEVEVTGSIASIEFSENGDGTVAITVSPSYSMNVNVDPEYGEKVDVTLSVLQEGLAMVASGDPDAVKYDFFASNMNLSVDEFVVDGEAIEMVADLSIADMAGEYLVSAGEMTEMETELSADQLILNVSANEPGGGEGRFAMNFAYADFAARSDGSMMMMTDPDALPEMLAAGMSTETEMSHGEATFEVSFKDSRDSFALDGSASGGYFGIGLDKDAMAYGVNNTDLDLVVSGSEIPLPQIAVSAAEIGFGFLMPISKSAEPQDFDLEITLDQFAVSEMIWGMVDPGGALPHDPATLLVGLTGKANLLFDLFDPEGPGAADGPMPGEIHELNIEEVKLSVAGAELTGEGAFTFDNANLEAFDGIPAPTGAVDMKLVGANGLIDSLIAMGLLPEDQAMMGRMMMGMFAVPGEGEDTLTSKIEIDGAAGSISANGQRLK